MSDLFDTLMNLVVFAFIGLLVWLYFRPAAPGGNETPDPADHGRQSESD